MKGADRQPVLFLFGTLEIGGSETKFVALATRLREQGHDVHVAYLRPPDTLLERLADVPCVHLGQQGKFSLSAFRRLKSYVAENNIATIVTVNFYPLCYAVPLKFAMSSNAPAIVASVNTTDFVSEREARFMILYKALLRQCDRIVFGANRQREAWQNRYGLADIDSVVVYNGVDTDRFNPDKVAPDSSEIRQKLCIPIEAPVVVTVGQFRPEKAQHVLVQAAAELAGEVDVHLLFVGDGVKKAELESQIHGLGLDGRSHMVGAVDDVRPFLKASNVFALPSIAVETFSNAALEAAAMGLPVVMTDIGGAAEMFPGQSAATCVSPADASALAHAILELLRQSDKCNGFGESLRHFVIDRYSISVMDQSWKDVLWMDDVAADNVVQSVA